MVRLSKENMGDRGRFKFKQEEVELPELDGSVLIRSPSVGERDELGRRLPDDEKDFTLEHTSILFSVIVVDPKVTPEEAEKFLADWPSSALDAITSKWSELIGAKEEMREAAGDFRSSK